MNLTPETQRLLEQKMKQGDYASVDDVVRVALEMLDDESLDVLDPKTLAAIDRADAEADRGGGIDLDDAFAMIRKKHFGTP